MTTLICLDRDGTIIEDDNFYLGSTSDWKERIKFLDGAISGIKNLNKLPDTKLAIITTQSGVALSNPEFSQLDEHRMNEINEYILSLLAKHGAQINCCFSCPFVDSSYVTRVKQRGLKVNPKYLSEGHPDIKPNPGMVYRAISKLGISKDSTKIFVVGDRKSDVQTGLNAGGIGILIPGKKTQEFGDIEPVELLRKQIPKRVYIAKDFPDAVEYIKTCLA